MTALRSPSYSKLTDFLLSHLVALAFLCFVVVAWFLYSDGAVRDMESSVNTGVDVSEIVATSNEISEPAEKIETISVAVSVEPEIEMVSEPLPVNDTEITNKVVDETVIEIEPARLKPTAPNQESITETTDKPSVVSPEAEVIAPEPETRQQLLQAARKAFWSGNLDVSEAAYIKYLKQFPEDANVFGELGNLYQSMGNRQAALNAYVEAAFRLQLQGEYQQLQQIVELLYKAGDPRAEQFQMPAYHDNSQGN